MEIKSLETLLELLLDAKIVGTDTVSGCTDEFISSIESTFKVILPSTYKNFLRLMGREAGGLYDDFGLMNIWSIEALENTRNDAQSYILDYAGYSLKETDFVFAESHRVMYLWFDTMEGPEPSIQMLDDGDETVRTAFNSFLEFLNVVVNEQLECVSILNSDATK